MNSAATALAALMRQLDASQWLSRDALAAHQHRQLGLLAAHCEKFSPQFRRRLQEAGLSPADLASPEGLGRLPVLTRRDLQSARDIYSESLPDGHGPTHETRTSGSTGEPVVVRRTAISSIDSLAATLREHLWHRRDFPGPLCAVRANITKLMHQDDWGPPVNLLFKSGPSLGIPITTAIDHQLELIDAFTPHTLLVYPSILAALARRCVARGMGFAGLRQILTIGETLPGQVREDARQSLNAEIADMYSSQEFGTIALQCPAGDLYHVMAENLIVEILRADGTPCGEGEAGRVTITDIRNYATPLIRYDIGDYAQPGPPCACGRGLPTLRRILGRERNLIVMPDGSRHWPLVGFYKFREIAPVVQYQFIQHSREAVELRLVTERPLDDAEEANLTSLIQKALGHPFALSFTYFANEIPHDANGKFEEFVCRL